MREAELIDLLELPELDSNVRYDPPNPADNVYDTEPPKRDPDYYCLGRGRWNRNHPEHAGKWKYCYARAGSGTNHVGYGRCKYHGGAASHVENRYAAMANDTVSEKIVKFLQDPNPLDLRADLAAARAIFEHTIERHEETTNALLAWHASFTKERRGLHDAPLYHFKAIQHAFHRLGGNPKPTDEELHEALEWGVEQARGEWVMDKLARQQPFAVDLVVEKPRKVVDISHAAGILKTITTLVTAILKHEREAFLSVFAFETLVENYGLMARKVLSRHFRRLGVNDGETVEAILKDIGKEWDRVPVLETSIPRLAAERRQQDEYLQR